MRKNNRKRDLIIIYSLSILSMLFNLCFYRPIEYSDTPEYIEAWGHISQGIIDVNRTPVYPCIIALATVLVGKAHMELFVVLLQHFVALVALWFFYKIVIRLTKSTRAAFWLTLCLGVLPTFITLHDSILTESFAMSASIFIVYCVLQIYEGRSWSRVAAFAFLLFFLVFLRPIFIYMLPVFTVALALMVWKKRELWKKAAACFAAIIAVTAVLLVYMSEFKKTYGIFAPTRVEVINEYYNLRVDGSLDPSKSPDKALGDYIAGAYKKNGVNIFDLSNSHLVAEEIYYILDHWNLPTLNKTIQNSKTLKNQLKGAAERFYYAGKELWLYPRVPSVISVLNITIGWAYLLLVAYAVWIVLYFRKYKRFLWTSFLLLMLGGSNLITAILGTWGFGYGEWSRLLYPSSFIYLLMAGQLIMAFVRNIKWNSYKKILTWKKQ